MIDPSAEADREATRKALGDRAEDYEVYGGGEENGHFTGIRPKSRQEKRHEARQAEEKYVVSRIVVYFENGHVSEMDIAKVNIVDRVTNKPLFDVAIEGEIQA